MTGIAQVDPNGERLFGPESGLGFSVTKAEADKFWINVDRAGECWLWLAGMSGGYGSFRIYRVRREPLRAHRIAFAIANGAAPARVPVLHSCDNKRCVNPAHLSLGTQSQNTRDAYQRGLINRPRATSCRVCGAPRWNGTQLARCREHYLEYQRSYARKVA